MTSEDFQAILALCQVKRSDGWAMLPEGRVLTVHVAANGVGLTVSRVTQVRDVETREKGMLQVRTVRDETYVFSVADVFACAFEDSGSKTARKAGFG